MKKIIFLILMLFLISGCTAEVNLTLDDDTINESISINYFANDTITKEEIKNSFREYTPAYNNIIVADTEEDEKQAGINYYKRALKDIGTGYNFKYDYDFPIATYNGARSLKKAFKSASVIKSNSDNTVTLTTDKNGIKLFEEYPNLTAVTINIKAANEVIESNGDYHDGIYTWIFNQNDYQKNIYLKMKMKEKESTETTTESTKEKEFQQLVNKNPILTIVIGIGLFIIIIAILLKISNKKYE